MALTNAVRKIRAARYSGTNSAEILSFFQDMCSADEASLTASILSSNASMCTIRIRSNPGNALVSEYGLTLNTWTIADGNQILALNYNDAQFAANYMSFTDMASAMGTTVGFQTALAASSGGFGVMPSITVPGLSNANFDVPIRPRQASNTFSAAPSLTGSTSLLGSLAITGLTNGLVAASAKLSVVIDGVTWYDRVRVNVANSGALQLAGAAILVHVTP